MTLRLEYTCTAAENKEAETLLVRQHYGRGSKWRARLVLAGLCALTAAGVYLRFKTEIAPEDRLWFVALVAVLFIVVLIFMLVTRRKTGQPPVQLDVSERELVFNSRGGRTAMQWSAFAQCLESPNVFVLVDRPKLVFFTVPKRAFPDEAAQNWFRAQANQPQSAAAAAALDDTFVPGRFAAAKGIALTLQLKFRDYLDRNLTSWRMKGIFLLLLALATGTALFSPPPPDAVNSPLKTCLIMLPLLLAIMTVVFFMVSFIWWRQEKKYLVPQQIVLTGDGIEFAGHDTASRLPWTTYKYCLEGRWSFFLWQPRGSLWLMLPKRAFASPSDLAQCRELLQANLKPSRWFYL